MLTGIVSFGDECAKLNVPGVYTKVAAYLDFIENYNNNNNNASSISTLKFLIFIVLFFVLMSNKD